MNELGVSTLNPKTEPRKSEGNKIEFVRLLEDLGEEEGKTSSKKKRHRNTFTGSRPEISPSSAITIPDEFVSNENSHEPLPFEIIHGASPEGDAVDMYNPVPMSPFANYSGKRGTEVDSAGEPNSA